MKLYLNFPISRSAALRPFIPLGASWKSMSLDSSYLWKAGKAPLYSIVYAGLSPLMSRFSCRSLKTQINYLSDINSMEQIRILCLTYSYNMNMYLLPLFEVTGNFPVRYVAIFILWSMILLTLC